MATVNPQRDNRKHQLERELHKIAIEELGESALERDSFYRSLIDIKPDDERFYRGLPRYMIQCLSKPRVMPDSEVEEFIKDSIEKAREVFKANPHWYL